MDSWQQIGVMAPQGRTKCIYRQQLSMVQGNNKMPATVLVVLSMLLLIPKSEAVSQPTVANVLDKDKTLVADWKQDSLAECTSDQAVAITLDSLLMPQSSRTNATFIVSLAFAPDQLASAVVFAAAGFTVAVQSPGEPEKPGAGFMWPAFCQQPGTQQVVLCAGVMSVSNAAGAVSMYDLGSDITAVTAVSLAVDGTRYRLSVNLACPQPRMVRSLS